MPKEPQQPRQNRYLNDSEATKYFYEGMSVSNLPRFKRVVFGGLNDLHKVKATQDIIKNGIYSHYYGWIFQTAHHNEIWAIEKNEAFFAGAMTAKKTFHLVTDISYCINAEIVKFSRYLNNNAFAFFFHPHACMNRKDRVGVTFNEILWMLDNHYTCRISSSNPLETVFEPSPSTPNEITIINYDPNLWTPNDWRNNVIDRLATILQNINEKRKLLDTKSNHRVYL